MDEMEEHATIGDLLPTRQTVVMDRRTEEAALLTRHTGNNEAVGAAATAHPRREDHPAWTLNQRQHPHHPMSLNMQQLTSD